MSDVGFYHLTRQTLIDALPRLLERVRAAGHNAVLRAPDQATLDQLDRALWTYTPGSFLAHGTARSSQPAREPVYLTLGDEVPNSATVLVLTQNRLDGDLARFARCLYLFDGNDPLCVETARTHWAQLRAAGHQLSYYQQSADGWTSKTD